MAKLKSVRLKDKEFVFKAFDNHKEAVPAKILFARFPQAGESFYAVEHKNIFDGIDIIALAESGRDETQKVVGEKLLNAFTESMKSGITDYRRFFAECVRGVENLEYEGQAVTADNFWDVLPEEAAAQIAREAFDYAQKKDEFTMGESAA